MAALQVNGSTYPPLCYLFRKINSLFTDLPNKIWMEARGFDLQYLLTVEYEKLRYEAHRSRNENKTQRTTTELVAVVRTPSFQLLFSIISSFKSNKHNVQIKHGETICSGNRVEFNLVTS